MDVYVCQNSLNLSWVCFIICKLCLNKGLPWYLSGKESTCGAGDMGSVPQLRRSRGEGNGNLLQYSSLGNPLDGEAWWATVHGVANSQTGLRKE